MMKFSVIYFTLFWWLLCGCDSKPGATLSHAENFQLPDLENIKHSLADIKGEIVMLHFWSDWCPHCRAEFEDLENAYRELKNQGFVIVAINVGQTADLVREIKEKYEVSFPMLCDQDKAISELYKVKGLPTSFFLDSERRILLRHIGWLKAEQIRNKFYELF